MKLHQLFILFAISISSSLTAQVYSDINMAIVPSNNNALSPGLSIGYHFNNSLNLGAFVQSQLGENDSRSKYRMNKENGVYYGVEIKGSTRHTNNPGWIYKGRIGFGNYKYDSHYEAAKHRVNSFHEIFLGKHISRKFSFGLGWRQSIETSDVFESLGGGRNNPIGVFDRMETDIYNDVFFSLAYTIGKTANPTVQKNKVVGFLNKLYLDVLVAKSLHVTDNYYSKGLDQFEIGFGFKITDDIGVGVGAFISNNTNSFSDELLAPAVRPDASGRIDYYYSKHLGVSGYGVQLRATPGKWHYKAEIGNISRTATNGNQYFDDPIFVDINVYTYYDPSPINIKTNGFNPYFNLHVGRTFWNALTLSAGYTYAPNINYTYIAYEGAEGVSSRARYHAPQIKLGFTLD